MSKILLRFLATAFFLSHLCANAGGEALFGLTFGMTVDQVKALVPTMTFNKEEGVIDVYTATDMPKMLSNTRIYQLFFAEKKLAKVYAASKDITNDVYGKEGKERFSNLRESLIKKYGQPTQEGQTIGLRLYKEPNEFYQCLKYAGCGVWLSIFKPPGKDIVIELQGDAMGSGWIAITADSNPEWHDALELHKKRGANADQNAL